MAILALDNATVKTGYAVFDSVDGKLLGSGVLTANKSKDIDTRLADLRGQIEGLISMWDVKEVAFEDTMYIQKGHNNLQTFKKLCWLQGMIVAICLQRGIKYSVFLPSEWRSRIGFLKGHDVRRDVQKQMAIDFVIKKYHIEVTDDEAEAICIGHSHLQNN